jgi:hypothetical protein
MDKPVWTMTPQPEHACEVNAGGTATARFPAYAALKARMLKNALQRILFKQGDIVQLGKQGDEAEEQTG